MKEMQKKIGILVTNLGTPDAPTAKALLRYLAEFLSDPRVIEIPRPIWWLILHGIILRIRPKSSAKLYKKIWTEKGSPLLVGTKDLVEKLKTLLNQEAEENIEIEMGMRYGSPSIPQSLVKLKEKNISKLIVLPLYPQYAAATVGSTFDKVSELLKKWRWVPELHFISGYHDNTSYILALAQSVQAHWATHPPGEKLLFSFHGIPKRCFDLGDPYYCFCHETARLVAEKLGLSEDRWQLVFQSRFGKAEWLQPYCVETLQTLAKDGVQSIDIICPGFAVDCLETLEEIAITNKKIFMDAGGKDYHYIPALTDAAYLGDVVSLLLSGSRDQAAG